MSVRRYNTWYQDFHDLSESERAEWVRFVIAEIREKAEETGDKSLKELADFLSDRSQCQIIGFSPGYEYLNVRDDGRRDWSNSFVHASGSVMLFVKHKHLPMFMMISPEIKWNKSDLPVKAIGGTG